MAGQKPPLNSAAKADRRDSRVEQLRHQIDTGRTGDKVDYPDPAAAPLGSDAEAGGHPPETDMVAHARRQERAGSGPSDTAQAASSWQPRPGRDWLYAGVAVLAAALFILLTISLL